MRHRAYGIDLVEDAVPDESTILCSRLLLEEHKLTEAIFFGVRSVLEEKRLKNIARLFTPFALANLYLLRRRSAPS